MKKEAAVTFDANKGLEMNEAELAQVNGAGEAQPRQYGGMRIRSMGSMVYGIWTSGGNEDEGGGDGGVIIGT
jgi:hypothetical protein